MQSRTKSLKQSKRLTPHNPASPHNCYIPVIPRCVRLASSLCVLSLTLGILPTPAQARDSFEDISSITAGPALLQQNPEARGVLKAGEEAVIASGMTARVLKAAYKPGQTFKRGALLTQFDCTQQSAELNALNQGHQTLSLQYKNQDHLFKAGAAGELDVSVARSEMQQAAAERDALEARMKHCRVYAPYDGIIVEKHIAAYETPAQNAPLYTVHRSGNLEISVIIPSKWLKWAKKGEAFTFQVDETGAELNGKISRIGAAVDPVSQTIEITGTTVGKTHNALSGMSGVANFERNGTL